LGKNNPVGAWRGCARFPAGASPTSRRRPRPWPSCPGRRPAAPPWSRRIVPGLPFLVAALACAMNRSKSFCKAVSSARKLLGAMLAICFFIVGRSMIGKWTRRLVLSSPGEPGRAPSIRRFGTEFVCAVPDRHPYPGLLSPIPRRRNAPPSFLPAARPALCDQPRPSRPAVRARATQARGRARKAGLIPSARRHRRPWQRHRQPPRCRTHPQRHARTRTPRRGGGQRFVGFWAI